MRILALMILGLMVVGCGKKPVEELSKEIVVGEYELKYKDGERGLILYRLVFLNDGSYEVYKNGKKEEGEKHWKIIGNEAHVFAEPNPHGTLPFFKVRKNTDGSLTKIPLSWEGLGQTELHYSKIK